MRALDSVAGWTVRRAHRSPCRARRPGRYSPRAALSRSRQAGQTGGPAGPDRRPAAGSRAASAQRRNIGANRTPPATRRRAGYSRNMLAVGDLLAGRYRVDARLGAGGMGSVWRAHDLRLDRDVALKVLLPSVAGDPVLAQRFDREAHALAAVTSPHVIAIYDVVTGAGGDPFLVMELCPDGSLGDRLDAAGSLPVAEALR